MPVNLTADSGLLGALVIFDSPRGGVEHGVIVDCDKNKVWVKWHGRRELDWYTVNAFLHYDSKGLTPVYYFYDDWKTRRRQRIT